MTVWLVAGCDQVPTPNRTPDSGNSETPKTKRETTASPIVAAARSQVGKTVSYDPSYVGLAYPNGDLPIEKGVCTDVVIRALRDASKIDLQKLVHEDMKAAFSAYPTIWGLKKPDPNMEPQSIKKHSRDRAGKHRKQHHRTVRKKKPTASQMGIKICYKIICFRCFSSPQPQMGPGPAWTDPITCNRD